MNSFLIGFFLGVSALQFQSSLPTISALMLLLGACCGLGVLLRVSLPPRFQSVVWLLPGLITGLLWADYHALERIAIELPPKWEGESLEVQGFISDLPTQIHQGMRFAFTVESVSPQAASIPKLLSLAWFVRNGSSLPELHPGQRWKITVKLKRPHGLSNPGGFDFEAWMLSQGFRATGAVDDRDPPILLGENHDLNSELGRLRDGVRAHLLQCLGDNPWAGVIVALVVGDQSLISPNAWNLFWQTGVGHLMSISGLHITMLAGLVAGAMRWIHPQIRWVTTVRWLAALSYSLLAGFSIPTQRTLYMIAVASLPAWVQVRPGLDKSLLLALTAALCVDPWAVLEPGFWLSFGAVSALMLADAHWEYQGSWLKKALSSQWVATMAMMPLLVLLFQQVSLVSPLANALAIPVVSLLVVPLALAGALPGLDGLLHGACYLFGWVIHYLQWLLSLPMTLWTPPEPSMTVFLLSLAGLIFLLGPRGLPGRWVGSLAMVPLLFSQRPVAPSGGLWMDVLDVGQGLSVVVRTHQHVLVYDTGPRYSDQNDGSTRALLPALRSMGVHGLDGLVVSHRDLDHSGGADSLVATLPPGFLLSSLEPEHELLKKVPQSIPCYQGQHWDWDGVQFQILHPAREALGEPGRKTNDQGCVLKITAQNHSLLLPADIEARSELELLERDPLALKSEILIAPHHGSKTSSTVDFIETVSPRWVIYAVGYRNRFGHPKPEIEERYREQHVTALRSDRDGDVQVRVENQKITVSTWRQNHCHYWQDDGYCSPGR